MEGTKGERKVGGAEVDGKVGGKVARRVGGRVGELMGERVGGREEEDVSVGLVIRRIPSGHWRILVVGWSG